MIILVEAFNRSTWPDGVIVLVELELELESVNFPVGRRYIAEKISGKLSHKR